MGTKTRVWDNPKSIRCLYVCDSPTIHSTSIDVFPGYYVNNRDCDSFGQRQ